MQAKPSLCQLIYSISAVSAYGNADKTMVTYPYVTLINEVRFLGFFFFIKIDNLVYEPLKMVPGIYRTP